MAKQRLAKRKSRFQRGSGVYMCMACSLMTRETGLGESDLRLCAACYNGKPGDEVAVSCGLLTEDAFFAKHGEHSAGKPRQVAPLVANIFGFDGVHWLRRDAMGNRETKLFTASVLGTIAFSEGRKSIPCHDAKLMALLGGGFDEAIKLMKAWSHAWHAANLAQVI